MPPVEIAYVPTRMAFENFTALEWALYVLLQRAGATPDRWLCVHMQPLAHALGRDASNIRKAARRLADRGYLSIAHNVVLNGQRCRVAYRILYREGVNEWLSRQAGHDVQPLQGE